MKTLLMLEKITKAAEKQKIEIADVMGDGTVISESKGKTTKYCLKESVLTEATVSSANVIAIDMSDHSYKDRKYILSIVDRISESVVDGDEVWLMPHNIDSALKDVQDVLEEVGAGKALNESVSIYTDVTAFVIISEEDLEKVESAIDAAGYEIDTVHNDDVINQTTLTIDLGNSDDLESDLAAIKSALEPFGLEEAVKIGEKEDSPELEVVGGEDTDEKECEESVADLFDSIVMGDPAKAKSVLEALVMCEGSDEGDAIELLKLILTTSSMEDAKFRLNKVKKLLTKEDDIVLMDIILANASIEDAEFRIDLLIKSLRKA